MPGIWPTLINFHDQTVSEQVMFSLGGLADSLYEYLLKMYILLGGGEDASKYKAMYLRAMETVISHILFRPMLPDQKDVLFAGDVLVHNENGILQPDGQHLSCFLGGMFALGGKMFDVAQHVDIGARLTKGCAWAYSAFPTGLMPEIFGLLDCQKPQLAACEWDENRWRAESGQQEQQQQGLPKGFRHVRDPKYQLRPEAAESLFVMYRVTGDPAYRETAWTMFQSIVKYTETALAYSTIADVAVKGETKKTDSMESFWMAETLKYLFLIFCPPETISLDNYVLTTEAHPFRL